MCGICGKVYFDSQRIVMRAELEQMSQTLEHRGPDGEGIWTAGHVGLAHRRLAIIDLRAVADQPMSNEDGSVWLTFNGEIYNFQELRVELVARGHKFRTTSDTEVIVHAYEEYGRDCLSRFRGMFAFALWDTRTRTLLLARDRIGKKPLYYYRGSDRFVFGSEIKALLADPAVPGESDPVAIDHYLALQYIPAPLTAFRGIRKLPAAHWLALHDGHVEIGQYWKLRYTPKRTISMRDAIAELQWHLAEAVRLRLVSDVPLGAFLSGGIDSSAVVTHMAQALDGPVRTFAVGFAEAAFDERPFARMVAERYGTAHTELVVEAPVADILPRLVWYYDEPLGDASAVPSYAIAALTRQHVTVVLNGDGGDENFAGYDRYITDRHLRHGDIVPLPLRRAFSTLLQRLPASVRQRQPLRKLVKIAAIMAQTPARRYARLGGHFTPEERQSLYTDAFRAAMAEADPEGVFAEVFGQSDIEDWTDTALNADVNLYLADDLLVKMDRATMAHALEARSPFLDHVLMEYVATLPPSFKLSGLQKKRILKASLRGLLPDAVLDRPKMGFCAPITTWFRGELRDMAYDILLAPRAVQRGYFRSQAVAELLDRHCRGEADHAAYLWDLLMLELWHRTFIDGDSYTASIPTRPLTNAILLSAS
jgi:asparagine synthase (glutamine-hydrolysing)